MRSLARRERLGDSGIAMHRNRKARKGSAGKVGRARNGWERRDIASLGGCGMVGAPGSGRAGRAKSTQARTGQAAVVSRGGISPGIVWEEPPGIGNGSRRFFSLDKPPQ